MLSVNSRHASNPDNGIDDERESVVEHLQLARDDGAQVAASAAAKPIWKVPRDFREFRRNT